MATELRLTFEVLTPLYLGGANQDAELRPPSLKGLLRYWWRAINPSCLEGESQVFGGAGPGRGQSPFLLTLDRPLRGNGHWDRSLVRSFDVKSREKNDLPQNGLAYLGFPFPMQDKERKEEGGPPRSCIEPGQRFELSCVFPRKPAPEIRLGIAASSWLLGHMGGAGSRSRRGFGSLALVEWTIRNDDPWEEMKRFPLLHETTTPEAWMEGYDGVRRTFREESPPAADEEETPHHPHFGPGFRMVLARSGYAKGEWAACLNEMGLALQNFRLCREPDYSTVKASLEGRGLLQRTPERASFGLPLSFRYRSVGGKPLDLVSRDGDRHGSLFHLRPTLIGGKLYPLYLRLAGDVPGETPPARVRGHQDSLDPLRENAMDLFMQHLQGVTWDERTGFLEAEAAATPSRPTGKTL